MADSILIIGGGNMGSALALRWRAAFSKTPITVVEPDASKRAALTKHGIKAVARLGTFKGEARIIVLAVKPQSAAEVIAQLKTHKIHAALLVSIMAGVPLSKLQGTATYAVRVMPNTPALIGEGMSVIVAPGVPTHWKHVAEGLFKAVGAVAFVPEERMLHAVTAISGSGPAYVFAFMESLMRAGKSLGLDEALARTLVTQTIRGAALLAERKKGDVVKLRQQVTSPKGTTEAALKIFKKRGLHKVVGRAAKAAEKRSKQLSK